MRKRVIAIAASLFLTAAVFSGCSRPSANENQAAGLSTKTEATETTGTIAERTTEDSKLLEENQIDNETSSAIAKEVQTDQESASSSENVVETSSVQAEATEAVETTETEQETVEGGTYVDANGFTFEPRKELVDVLTASNVSVSADDTAETLGMLEAGTQVERIAYNQYWSQIIYNGTAAFFPTAYLSAGEETSEAVSASESVSAPESVLSSETAEVTTASKMEPVQASDYQIPDLSGYTNEIISFGIGNDRRDEYNIPIDTNIFAERYANYNADFIQDTTQKVIYLTMDEGYEAGYTPGILDTLKAKNVHAVFFLTKQFFDSSPELIQRMIDEGHTIANHSSAHPADGMPSLGIEGQVQDIMTMHNLVLNKFGYEMKLFRYPSGLFSEQSLALLNSLGYRAVFWSFQHVDYNLDAQPDPGEALTLCINCVHNGAIYLLHAVSSTNASILGDWIDAVRSMGYEFGEYPVQ